MFNFIRMLALFYQGLGRCFKIIRFGDVPEYRIQATEKDKYHRLIGTCVPKLVAAFYVYKEFLLSRQKYFAGPVPEVLYCGSTKNNEREFLFLQKIMVTSDGKSFWYEKIKNVSFFTSIKGKKVTSHAFLKIVLFLCCLVYLCRIKACPTSVSYLIRFVNAYFRLYVYYHLSTSKPKVSIFANDHTPISVACSMIMKLHDVPRVYVQHAEVTQDFPPLDFEYSVLRNKKSLDVYGSIGAVKGNVYIVPRNEKATTFTSITDEAVEISESVRIVIYLSSTFLTEKVEEAVLSCRCNADVQSVEIKKHPRSFDSDFDFLTGVSVYDEVPEYKHIALVPNSSVVIDLLHRGTKVYQLFELDSIREDYYGFVKESVTPKVTAEDLKVRFWEMDFYNERWLERFEAYDPSVAGFWKEDLARLRKDLSKLLMAS